MNHDHGTGLDLDRIERQIHEYYGSGFLFPTKRDLLALVAALRQAQQDRDFYRAEFDSASERERARWHDQQRLEAERDAHHTALEPIIREVNSWTMDPPDESHVRGTDTLTYGDLRRASAALSAASETKPKKLNPFDCSPEWGDSL